MFAEMVLSNENPEAASLALKPRELGPEECYGGDGPGDTVRSCLEASVAGTRLAAPAARMVVTTRYRTITLSRYQRCLPGSQCLK